VRELPAEVRGAQAAALPRGSRSPVSGPVPVSLNLEVPFAHTGALFFTLRASEAWLWPNPFAQVGPQSWLHHYREALTRPPLFDADARAFEWDHDRWALNVLGHGLLGSELYFRPRRCGASPLGAFAFAAGASMAWEYAFEGNGVRPSALDLVYTPLAGLLLGEGRYWGYAAAGAIGNRPLRSVVRAVLDPLGEFERGFGATC